MFNALEPWHLLVIVGVLVVLFGAKRLPGSARSLGRSMRIFRSEMANGRSGDDEATTAASTTIEPAALSAPAVAAGHDPVPSLTATAPVLADAQTSHHS